LKQDNKIINKILDLILKNNLVEAEETFKKTYKKNSKNTAFLNLYATFNLNLKQYEASIKCFEHSLACDSNQPEIYFKLGIIYDHLSRTDKALISYKKAESLNYISPDLFNNLGLYYFNISEYDNAIYYYKKTIEINSAHAIAHNNIGNAYKAIGQTDNAIECYKTAISILPAYENAYSNLCDTLIQASNETDALKYLNIIINLNANEAKYFNDRAVVLFKMGKFELALNDYNTAIKINPNYAQAFHNLGILFFKEKEYRQAFLSYTKAINLNPKSYEAFHHRAQVFIEDKKYIDAMNDLNQAIDLNPNYAEAFTTRGLINFNINEYDKAIRDYDKSIELNPGFKLPELNKSLILLLRGNYLLGWKLYESRWFTKKFHGKSISTDKPKFNLEVESHKTIFIYREQGIGDQILFMTLLRDLHEKYKKIIVSMDSRLIPIFSRSFQGIQFISDKNFPEESLYDQHIAMGSLGLFLRNSIASFKKQESHFLLSNKIITSNFSEKLHSSEKIVCGISWKSKNDDFGHNKSVDLSKLAPIFKNEKLNIVNLQYGEVASDIESISENDGIQIEPFNQVDKTNDIDGLFSLVDACDFIVTISNVTAHIAGSLGKRVFLLAPKKEGKLFYWGIDGHECLWYPSVKIFRQSEDGSWEGAILEIKKEIEEIFI